MSVLTRPTLLAWAGFGLAVGITAIGIALYSSGPGVTDPGIQPAADPGIKVWDATPPGREP